MDLPQGEGERGRQAGPSSLSQLFLSTCVAPGTHNPGACCQGEKKDLRLCTGLCLVPGVMASGAHDAKELALGREPGVGGWGRSPL